MANLTNIWKSFRARFSDSPVVEAINTGSTAIQASATLAKAIEEESGNLDFLKSLIASAPLLFDILNLPVVQIAANTVPFLSIGSSLLKLYSQLDRRELGWEECALSVISAAYMQSLAKFLGDKDVLDKLNDRPVFEYTQKGLNGLHSLEFNESEARETLSRFHSSKLAQACCAVLIANLKAGGLEEPQATLLAGRVARDTQSNIRIAVAELGDSVRLLNNFFSTGAAEQHRQDLSLEEYLSELTRRSENHILGDTTVRIKDIYVPVEAELLNWFGSPKSYLPEVVVLEEWVRGIVSNNLEANKIIFIQGKPGRGKSVFCWVFAAWICKKLHPLWTPLVVRLRDMHNFSGNFENDLRHAVDRNFARGEDWLSNGRRFLFFLDGFDELVLEGRPTADLKRFLKSVGDFQKRCYQSPEKGHRVILTGRPLALYGVDKEMPENLLRVEILPFDDSFRSYWLDKWRGLVGQDESDRFGRFLNDGHCPKGVNELSREPLLLYLLAAMHRDGELSTEMFLSESADQTKLMLYEKTLDWSLSHQRNHALNYALTGLEIDILKNVLAEAGLCSFQTGDEQARLAMVARRIENCELGNSRQCKTELTNVLATFYLQESGEGSTFAVPLLTGSVEFTHKSFGEFLCARRIARSLEEWAESGDHPTSDIDNGVYDLLGPRLLTSDVVGYLMAMVRKFHPPERLRLFGKLKAFYFRWQEGEFRNREPDKNLPQRKHLDLQVDFKGLALSTNLLSIEVNAGLNILLLLLQLRVQAKSLNGKLPRGFAFNPCWSAVDSQDPDALLRTIYLADSLQLGLFRGGLGAYMELADLTQADLRRADLGNVNLREANLGEANLSGASLSRANLRGANLGRADLREADLRGANLGKADLREADLRRTNLIMANLNFADLGGVNLSEADLSKAQMTSVDLRGAALNEANLSRANLRAAKLEGAKLGEADLWRADLQGANLNGALLSEANLREANLWKADLRGTNLFRADLSRTNLSGANLSKADLRWVDLSMADLHGANLSEANLRGANLSEANLRDTDLCGADLEGVKDLTSCQVKSAKYAEETKFDSLLLKQLLTPP